MVQPKLADIGGVGKQSQINYESGKRQPDAEYLARIATAGADIAYILTGVRTISAPPGSPMHRAMEVEDRFGHVVAAVESIERSGRLPESKPAAELASAGKFEEDGSEWRSDAKLIEIRGDEISDCLALPSGWFVSRGLNLHRLRMMRVPSASMSPLIQMGDLVMIDHARVDPDAFSGPGPRPRSPIYMCEIDGRRFLGRVERAGSTGYQISYDNIDYPPDLCAILKTRILGRLVWWSHTEA